MRTNIFIVAEIARRHSMVPSASGWRQVCLTFGKYTECLRVILWWIRHTISMRIVLEERAHHIRVSKVARPLAGHSPQPHCRKNIGQSLRRKNASLV